MTGEESTTRCVISNEAHYSVNEQQSYAKQLMEIAEENLHGPIIPTPSTPLPLHHITPSDPSPPIQPPHVSAVPSPPSYTQPSATHAQYDTICTPTYYHLTSYISSSPLYTTTVGQLHIIPEDKISIYN